jgi:hypothetical protein
LLTGGVSQQINSFKEQFGMNPFDDLPDPLARLEEIEIVQIGQGMAMTQMSDQLRSHSQLGVNVSESLIEIVRHIDILSSKIFELEYRLEQVEKNESIE